MVELVSAALYSRAFSTQPTMSTFRLLSATRKGISYEPMSTGGD